MSRYCMILNDYDLFCVMLLQYWGNVYLTELPCPSFASVMAVHRPEFKGCIFILYNHISIFGHSNQLLIQIFSGFAKRISHFKSAPKKQTK